MVMLSLVFPFHCLVLAIASSDAQAVEVNESCNAHDFDASSSTSHLPHDTLLFQMSNPALARSLVERRADGQKISSRSLAVSSQSLTYASVAAHIKAFSRNPMNIASVIQSGVQAIIRATVHFSAQPPRVVEGISALGEDLFECVEKLLTDEHKNASEFLAFKDGWQAGFEAIPGAAASIESDLEVYARDGAPEALIEAIGTIINEAGMIVSLFLPPQIATEVANYLSAIDAAFVMMGSSWDEFAKGNTVEGIEEIYWGLRDITDSLMPDVLKNNTVYNTIIGTLDFVLGNLSQHVLEYERHILESKVCWRTEKSRRRERPMHCPRNYAWDGAAFCYPKVSWLAMDSSHQLEGTLQRKGGDDGGHYNGGHNAIPARCDDSGNYPEKHGQYCYTPCGAGFRVKPETYLKCISACEGNFSAETPLMCGRDAGIVTKAILEMVTTVLNSAFSLAENIIKMKEHGVDADTLSATIQVFIDMGKPFANPTCPAPEEGTLPGPDVSPAPGPSADGRRRTQSGAARMQCSTGATVFLSSFRHQQLQDNNGGVGFSPNKLAWEHWTLSNAGGEGKVFISSHRGQQLSDRHGSVALSPNKLGWEVWTVTDASDGKMFLSSHRHQQLKDQWGSPSMSWNSDEYEEWDITMIGGSPACTTITTTSVATLEVLLQNTSACTDDNEGLKQALADIDTSVRSCGDLVSKCTSETDVGSLVRNYCPLLCGLCA